MYDIKVCEDCLKEFKAKKYKSGIASKRKYCDSCLSKKLSTHKRKENYYVDKQGYAWIRINDKFTQEHRYVLEQKIGRKLQKHESAHHINGIRHDNRAENLELWVGPIRYGQRAADIKCHNCGHSYKID